MATPQSSSNSDQPSAETSSNTQVIRLPTNIKKDDIIKEIESLGILEKRTHRISRESSSRQQYSDQGRNNNTDSETPANLEYFEGAEQDNYKKQLANDVLMLVNFVLQSINDPVAHRKLIEEVRDSSVKSKENMLIRSSRRLLVHDAPVDLYYGNEHILKLLNIHHYCTFSTTGVACIVNTGYFGALVPTSILWVSNTLGFVIGLVVMGGIQVVFKDTIIESTRLSESKLKPGVEHVRERNPLRRNQPPQDFDIKHFGKIAKVKRFWLAAGFTTGIAVLSGFNHMTHLDNSAIDELYRYERDKIVEVVNKESERESKDFQEYKAIIKKYKTIAEDIEKDSENSTLKAEKDFLEVKKNALEATNALLEEYNKQLEYIKKFDNCRTILNRPKENAGGEYCDSYINKKGNIKSGYDEKMNESSDRIKEFGGTHRDGQIPTGSKVNSRIKFEKNATGDSWPEILLNYYKGKGQEPKFHELKKEIENGKYFNEKIDSKTRYEIGMKRFWRDLAQNGFPNGMTQAVLIFLIEMLAIGTSAMIMGDRTYRSIVLNGNVQDFSQEYLHDLADVICSLSERVNSQTKFLPEFNEEDGNISLTKDEIFEIAKKQSQNGKLTGLGSIISTHINLVFQSPYDQQSQHIDQTYSNIRDIPTQSLELQSKSMAHEVDCLTEELNEKDAKLRSRIAQRNFREEIAEQNRESEVRRNEDRNRIAEEEESNRQTEKSTRQQQIDRQALEAHANRITIENEYYERHGGKNLAAKFYQFLDGFLPTSRRKLTSDRLTPKNQKVTKESQVESSDSSGNNHNGSESSIPSQDNRDSRSDD